MRVPTMYLEEKAGNVHRWVTDLAEGNVQDHYTIPTLREIKLNAEAVAAEADKWIRVLYEQKEGATK